MYSFEGDYRRKPQQNLAGASRRDEKPVFLQHTQLKRFKREQQRKTQNATSKIQAHVRSFLVRRFLFAKTREEFDQAQRAAGRKNLSLEDLIPYIRKLLFFYNYPLDAQRFVWLLQHFLKHQDEIKVQCVSSSEWLWRLRWILQMCMEYNAKSYTDGAYSMAIPLRALEAFTTREDTEKVLRSHAYRYLESIFVYLLDHKYFEQLRVLIDNKIPPMWEVTSVAPTLIAKCLLDMIKRPLELISHLEPRGSFSQLVLQELCRSLLSPKLSDPVRMFVIPALAEFKECPYVELIDCIDRTALEPTIGLFYSILSLESDRCLLLKSQEIAINYLRVLASMSVTIIPRSAEEDIDHSDDSDTESDLTAVDHEQANIQQQCIEMLNEQQRVHGILQAVDRCEDSGVLQPLCQLCYNLLITDKLAVQKYKLLHMLAFKPIFLKKLWNELSSVRQTSLFGGAMTLSHVISRGIALSLEDSNRIVPQLAVFCSLFSLLIATLHDKEFFVESEENGEDESTANIPSSASQSDENIYHPHEQQAMPLTISELVTVTGQLKGVCLGIVELAFPDCRPTVRDDYKNAVLGSDGTRSVEDISVSENAASDYSPIDREHDMRKWSHLFKVTVGLLRQLHARDLRRQFCPEGHWIALNITIPVDKPQEFTLRRRRLAYVPFQSFRVFMYDEPEQGPLVSVKDVRTLTLLREIPFVVPFNERVVVFQSLIYRDKMEQQGELVQFMRGPSIQISVRRNYLYEDAFQALSPEKEPELRLKVRVQFVNLAGMEEAGVDGGGLFREFLSELLKTSFDPNRGFFRLTKDNMLYPNPTVQLLVGDFPKHYYFIGRILGKALYENLLVELPFAEFFLSKIVGRQSDVDVHHLASLDPIMYRNLLYLKSYKGDVTELGLDFTVLSDELGERRIEELKPNGANITVTNHNRIEYIHLMADYKLNKQIRSQCYAFKQGIGSVVSLDWLQMFNNKEFQVLISGAEIPVDVNDLELHTNYSGGYHAEHPTITAFWKVVHEFSDQQKSQLLKFVTSCSRPPLLGFKELDPPFCIHHAGSVDRLPTASTCMNLLKLPEFPDEETLREKLLYAVQAGAGFELS